jgi:hypothetical protein
VSFFLPVSAMNLSSCMRTHTRQGASHLTRFVSDGSNSEASNVSPLLSPACHEVCRVRVAVRSCKGRGFRSDLAVVCRTFAAV